MEPRLEFVERRGSERLLSELKVEVKEVGPEEVARLLQDKTYLDLSKPEGSAPRAVKGAFFLFAQNISVGGLSILSDVEIRPETVLALAVHLPEAPLPLHTLAMVIWSNPVPGGKHEAGLRFLGIHKEDVAKVDRYILMQKRAEQARRNQ